MTSLPVHLITCRICLCLTSLLVVFYSRQLWHYLFGLHNLSNATVHMYTYHEGEDLRGQNEVTSMLFDYLKHNLPPANDNMHICFFSDSCPGQNKNHVMLRLSYILVMS